MDFLKQIKNNKSGMAMVIVLTACFVVLVTVSIGASIIANNLDKVGSASGREKALANAQSGLERARGMREANGALFDGCSAGECLNTATGACGVCSETIYNVGDNRHQLRIQSLTLPAFDGEAWLAGTISMSSTGYYKNSIEQRTSNFCLDYCTAAGFNCDVDGCGGSCGTCPEGQSCTAGVCSGGATSCVDASIECDDACVEGDTCGGGTVIDATNNVIAALGGCADESGNQCGSGNDELARSWDNSGQYDLTNASDYEDGRVNFGTLQGIDINRFDAVRFCDDLTFNGFDTWYLPANKELDKLVEAKNSGWATGFADACYWSSTEQDNTYAFYRDLSMFAPCADGDKSRNLNVRCMRRY